MKKYLILALLLFTTCVASKEKTVFLPTFAQDNAMILPRFLHCLDKLDYDKKLITLYFHIGKSEDNTEEIIQEWVHKNGFQYKEVILAHSEDSSRKGELSYWREVREQARQVALERDEDYFFCLDNRSLIAPNTLKILMEKGKPIIAPMLRAIPEFNDPFSNFFAAVSETGYFQDDPMYWLILNEVKKGTFSVPVVHTTYLMEKRALEKVSYQDESGDFEFIVFSRNARKYQVDLCICNEESFGVLFHFSQDPNQDDAEKIRLMRILDLPEL